MTLPVALRAGLLALSAWAGTAAAAPSVRALADDPAWQRLLHVEPGTSHSAIHSPGFFLAGEAGRSDPLRELEATVAALQAQPSGPADNAHAQCRFPARLAWLRARLPLALPTVDCPNWRTWSRDGQLEGLSLVLATGYLGNPASFYGHTLLKFRPAEGARRSNLADPTVNYGALIEGQDDPITYIVKGVFGGYDGGFSDIDYYFHRSQYGETELRDLWEFELELTPDEVRLVAAHAWEVLGQRYQYFFFRRNCAFRMAELVELIEGVSLIPPQRPWTVPQSLLQRANDQQRADGRPLVRKVRYEPSRQSRFHASHAQLTPAARTVFQALALRPSLSPREGFDALSLPERHAVLDALMDYHLFVTDPKDREAGRMPPMYGAALAERYRQAPGPRAAGAELPPAPHRSRAPGWLQLGAQGLSHDGGRATHGLLRVRPAYYDPLDASAGHLPQAALAMGDLSLRVGRDGLRLQQLDLIAIDSVNPGVSGLPGDRGEAWRIKLGAEPVHPGCADCRVLRAQGDIGRGRRFEGGTYAAAFVGGALQEHHQGHGEGFVRALLRGLVRPSAEWGAMLEIEQRWPIGGPQKPYRIDRLALRWSPSPGWDARLQAERSTLAVPATRVQLGIGVYW